MSCTGHYILTIHDAHPILPRLPGPNWVWAGIWKSGNTQTLTVVEWEGFSARRWMHLRFLILLSIREDWCREGTRTEVNGRSDEHTSEIQSRGHLVCSLLLV